MGRCYIFERKIYASAGMAISKAGYVNLMCVYGQRRKKILMIHPN